MQVLVTLLFWSPFTNKKNEVNFLKRDINKENMKAQNGDYENVFKEISYTQLKPYTF